MLTNDTIKKFAEEGLCNSRLHRKKPTDSGHQTAAYSWVQYDSGLVSISPKAWGLVSKILTGRQKGR